MIEEQIIKAFGHVLKESRVASGMSQEELAYAIDSHATHVSRLENGHKQPTLTTIFKIAEKLGLEPQDLIYRTKVYISD